MRVAIDGRKIGHMHEKRHLEGDAVLTRRTMELELARSGTRIVLHSVESTRESVEGEPLGFSSVIDLGGARSETHGTRQDGARWRIETKQGGHSRIEHLEWPQEALLAEGLRLAEAHFGLTPGTRHSLIAFDLSSLQPIHIQSHVVSRERLVLPGGPRDALRIEQQLLVGGASIPSTSWTDPEGNLLRTTQPMMGLAFEMEACDRDCALAPNQPADIIALTSLNSPRPISQAEAAGPLYVRLRGNESLGQTLGTLPGQKVTRLSDGEWQLRVDPRGDSETESPPAAIGPNRWLQSDADELLAAATSATQGATSATDRMRRLESFVRERISIKSLRIGYGSALEAFAGREGDCTEHAVLLAALARAVGIPALVASGMAYTDAFGDQRQAFVPHAWVMAWVDESWQGFDAALGRYDAGHIAFSLGDGEPFHFYRGIEAMEGISILDVDTEPFQP